MRIQSIFIVTACVIGTTGCAGRTVSRNASVVSESHLRATTSQAQRSIKVVSDGPGGLNQPSCTVANSSCWRQPAEMRWGGLLAHFGAAELRAHLMKRFIVTSLSADYEVRLAVTELAMDINEGKAALDTPTLQTGLILSTIGTQMATVAPLMGPIGSLVTALDVVTGIPMKSDRGNQIGAVAVEVSIHDANGAVLESFPVKGIFGREYSLVGDTSIGSYTFEAEGTTPQDAVRLIAEEMARRIAKKYS